MLKKLSAIFAFIIAFGLCFFFVPPVFANNNFTVSYDGNTTLTFSNFTNGTPADCNPHDFELNVDETINNSLLNSYVTGFVACSSTSATIPEPLYNGTYFAAFLNASETQIWFSNLFTVTNNPRPTQEVVQITPSNTTVNSTYTATGSVINATPTSLDAQVQYADGLGFADILPPIFRTNNTFSLSNDYQSEGTYRVTVAVTDNQGIAGIGTAQVTVISPPNVGAISVSNPVVQVNSSITASASFSDADTTDTHTAIWNWGDGTTSTGTVTESNGSGTVGADSHTYTAAGVYTVTLTVSDDDGTSGQAIYQYASVYNPTAQGLFSAGEHFSSPAGAYPANSNLTGTVKFGLSYKYQSTMPVGDKQFTMNFNAANLLFNATSVSSLVISNGMATLTGTGTINGGSQSYNFLVTGVNGGGIRIQITDPSNNNNIIYDTQPEAAVSATPTTPVSGHVVVH